MKYIKILKLKFLTQLTLQKMISPRQMAFKRIPTLKMRKFIDSIIDEALKASLKTVYDAEINN